MKKNYVPMPIDTSDVDLSEELNGLIEKMAKNVHEVWAQNRMEQGWTYGVERSDSLKQHPCLIPYDELPDDLSDWCIRTGTILIQQYPQR